MQRKRLPGLELVPWLHWIKAVSMALSEEELGTDIRTQRAFLFHCVLADIITIIFVFTNSIIFTESS